MSARGLTVDESSAHNASSEATTTASGVNTHGTLNQHPGTSSAGSQVGSNGQGSSQGVVGTQPFRVGVSEDRNKRWRRTMEDAHAFVYGFGGVQGQGFFSIFDGHAGKNAAEFCGQHFHEYLLDSIINSPDKSVPDLFNLTFHNVDKKLSDTAASSGTSSGCTAVTVFLRLEDAEGKPAVHAATGGVDPKAGTGDVSSGGAAAAAVAVEGDAKGAKADSSSDSGGEKGRASGEHHHHHHHLFHWRHHKKKDSSSPDSTGHGGVKESGSESNGLAQAPQGKDIRRVLYTANVGDARAVLCRGGKAVRLTYDHKGSDTQEAKRITDAGGFVMNNRVNGVLAVTRSLGDSAMKQFVVGSPYTTETALSSDDTFLIVACDGLWDVTDDQDAVDLVADIKDPQQASAKLLEHALSNFSTDNTSVMVVRFDWDPSCA